MRCRTRRLISLTTVAAALAACSGGDNRSATSAANPASAPPGTYSTTFDRNEKPLSEGGAWRRANNAWTDVQTVNGLAYGTNGASHTYDDSYALLTGTFGADQTIEAIVFRDQKLKPGRTHEVELLLRFSDDSSSARGYECLFNFAGGVQIMRWNGPFGDFTELPYTQLGNLNRHLVTGDVIKATIHRNVISMYVNGALLARASDSTFKTGQPGISFFIGPDGSNALLAISRYTVTSK
jgi:hypothetical protein